MATFDWVQPGVEVVERIRGGFGNVVKIAKVHKTGRFTLDITYPTGVKDTTQYRALSNDRAQSVGGSGWQSRDFERVTDLLRVDIAAYREYQRARQLVKNEADRLNELLSVRSQAAGNRDAVIAEANRIGPFTYDRLEPIARRINASGGGLIDYSALTTLAEELNK